MPLAAHRHRFRTTIRWGDLDAFGHVNNAALFQYFESARLAYIEQVLAQPITALGENVILADTQATFLLQLHYPGTVDIRTRIERIGHSSLEMSQVLLRGDDDTRYATSRSALVWFDFQSQQSQPLPDWVREAIRDYEAIPPEGLD